MPEPIQMLWIGPRLSAMERLSMRSFLAHGHPVRLFTYGDVEGIPEGVERHDARDVLPDTAVFTYADGFGKGSHAGFANLFRYKLLLDHGGYWSDTDTVCLRPFDFELAYVVGRERLHPEGSGERRERLAIGVLKVPRDSPVMRECYESVAAADKGALRWGESGPQLLTRCFIRHGLVDRSLAPDVFYPLDWWRAGELVTRPLQVPAASYAVHLWNGVWREKGVDKDGAFAPGCAYETLKRRYGV